jgi:iron complex outermembrane receptor protein
MKQAGALGGRRRALRAFLLGSLSLAALTTTAVAQGDAEDEIVVTGSRIRRNPLGASRPALNVDSESIERAGISTIGEIVQPTPGSGGPNSKVCSPGNCGDPPDGVGAAAAETDLRVLGSRRVPALVDGLWWVNGSSASGAPGAADLNAISTGVIDRIEVLEDGASPTDGSGAIAGAVSIITKRRQDGFAASAQIGAFDEAGGETHRYRLSFGAGNDRTDNFFAVQHVHQNSVSAADRDSSDFPGPTLDECFVTFKARHVRRDHLIPEPAHQYRPNRDAGARLAPGLGSGRRRASRGRSATSGCTASGAPSAR